MPMLMNANTRDRFDPDAQSYINAVEFADGLPLEAEVKVAITRFVKGCKDDGIWNAIKASCIMAGARSLAGALIPLVGTAPTNFNFVAGDYDRKTGLKGDSTNKYLNSNRNNNADPQNSQHLVVNMTEKGVATGNLTFIGPISTLSSVGISHIGYAPVEDFYFVRSRNSVGIGGANNTATIGFIGMSRSSSTNVNIRIPGLITPWVNLSETPFNENIFLYRRLEIYSQSRFSFYSIGENLDLAKLDARVTALMTAFNRYIP